MRKDLANRFKRLCLKQTDKIYYHIKGDPIYETPFIFVRCESDQLRKIMYEFFIKLDLKIISSDEENYESMHMVDINLKNEKTSIRYTLWRPGVANQVRYKNYISYFDFVSILYKDKNLYKIFYKIFESYL